MKTPVCVVDAFAAERFHGNPAAVCLLDSPPSVEWMQAVAAEMNLSETAFVVSRGDGWGLRWFTPTVEVALCGHATLASAHVLWDRGLVTDDQAIRFHTERSGVLVCERQGDRIAMDFPASPVTALPAPAGLAKMLGVEPVWVGRSEFDLLCELADAVAVRELRPDLAALATLPFRGVIVTARGEEGFDCVSRFFAPGVGVPEDPVTGSVHCALAPYWAARLGRTELRGWQASRRGGEVRMTLAGDRVWLGGTAVTVWQGELL